jgi:hypothetical protein
LGLGKILHVCGVKNQGVVRPQWQNCICLVTLPISATAILVVTVLFRAIQYVLSENYFIKSILKLLATTALLQRNLTLKELNNLNLKEKRHK